MDQIRQHLVDLLAGKGAHLEFEKAVAGFPVALRGKKVRNAPHTAWQLLEHIRIAQWDILEFSRNPKHVSPEWPEEYWPPTPAPPKAADWAKSVRQIVQDREAMQKLISNPKLDLVARLPHGDGQTVMREVFIMADHMSYHLGQLVFLRKQLE